MNDEVKATGTTTARSSFIVHRSSFRLALALPSFPFRVKFLTVASGQKRLPLSFI
jgi:hypothetical protein